jgi:hypothetical protein
VAAAEAIALHQLGQVAQVVGVMVQITQFKHKLANPMALAVAVGVLFLGLQMVEVTLALLE